MAFESIAPMVKTLKTVEKYINEDPSFKKQWFAKNRDWKVISKSTKLYFLMQAVDKILSDAKDLILEDGIEKAAPEDLKQLNHYINILTKK